MNATKIMQDLENYLFDRQFSGSKGKLLTLHNHCLQLKDMIYYPGDTAVVWQFGPEEIREGLSGEDWDKLHSKLYILIELGKVKQCKFKP